MVGSRQYALAEVDVEEPAVAEELARLRGENLALTSLLHGLCVALSQVSELHREVVIQACDYAKRVPEAQVNPHSSAEAFNRVVAQLRAAIMDRYRSF